MYAEPPLSFIIALPVSSVAAMLTAFEFVLATITTLATRTLLHALTLVRLHIGPPSPTSAQPPSVARLSARARSRRSFAKEAASLAMTALLALAVALVEEHLVPDLSLSARAVASRDCMRLDGGAPLNLLYDVVPPVHFQIHSRFRILAARLQCTSSGISTVALAAARAPGVPLPETTVSAPMCAPQKAEAELRPAVNFHFIRPRVDGMQFVVNESALFEIFPYERKGIGRLPRVTDTPLPEPRPPPPSPEQSPEGEEDGDGGDEGPVVSAEPAIASPTQTGGAGSGWNFCMRVKRKGRTKKVCGRIVDGLFEETGRQVTGGRNGFQDDGDLHPDEARSPDPSPTPVPPGGPTVASPNRTVAGLFKTLPACQRVNISTFPVFAVNQWTTSYADSHNLSLSILATICSSHRALAFADTPLRLADTVECVDMKTVDIKCVAKVAKRSNASFSAEFRDTAAVIVGETMHNESFACPHVSVRLFYTLVAPELIWKVSPFAAVNGSVVIPYRMETTDGACETSVHVLARAALLLSVNEEWRDLAETTTDQRAGKMDTVRRTRYHAFLMSLASSILPRDVLDRAGMAAKKGNTSVGAICEVRPVYDATRVEVEWRFVLLMVTNALCILVIFVAAALRVIFRGEAWNVGMSGWVLGQILGDTGDKDWMYGGNGNDEEGEVRRDLEGEVRRDLEGQGFIVRTRRKTIESEEAWWSRRRRWLSPSSCYEYRLVRCRAATRLDRKDDEPDDDGDPT